MISTRTKTKAGAKTARSLVENPSLLRSATPAMKLSYRAAKPVMKRRTQRRVERVGTRVRDIAAAAATYVPQTAQALGFIEPPKEKRTAPRVAAGAVLGATAVWFLEPGAGRRHREQLAGLVG